MPNRSGKRGQGPRDLNQTAFDIVQKATWQMPKEELTWDVAIEDAKHEIERAKKRIAKLSDSIKAFNEFKKTGVPFPREKASF
jgi:predicted translin family RNA/ssDNA-binding protein